MELVSQEWRDLHFRTILIQFDYETCEQRNNKHTPIASVNDFLVGKGYTPIVRGKCLARLVEIVDIYKSVDPLPQLEELRTVTCVVSVALNSHSGYPIMLTRGDSLRIASGIRPLTLNKVDKITARDMNQFRMRYPTLRTKIFDKNWLYELGVLLLPMTEQSILKRLKVL